MPTRIDTIIHNLTRPIRPAYVPPPKPQQSWASLKPGDHLRAPTGIGWQVTETTDQGARLTNAAGGQTVLSDRGWAEAGWVKERRPR